MTRTRSRSPDTLDDDLEQLRRRVPDPDQGFFGPDSTFWRIGRENVLALPGPAALLLQLAHPHVAAGVDDHSNFRDNPTGRLHSTFLYVHRITFGNTEEAVETAQLVRDMHDRVQGTLPETVGSFSAGSSYDANRPDLLLWVHATLIDQALVGYEALVQPLSRREKEAYYEESKTFARLFGVPESMLPETLSDFYDYYESMLTDTLAVGRQGHELRRELFGASQLAKPFQYVLAGGFLPRRVRDLFGLPWSSGLQTLFDAFCWSSRHAVPLLPRALRYVPKYRKRRRELGLSSPSLVERLLPGGLRH